MEKEMKFYSQHSQKSRRQFVAFLGASGVAANLGAGRVIAANSVKGIQPSQQDDVVTAAGLTHNVLVAFDDLINANGQRFGFNNDYIGIQKASNGRDLWMLVNHETADPFLVGGWKKGESRTAGQVQKERAAVGVSILYLEKTSLGWNFNSSDSRNRRVSGLTPIPFSGTSEILGEKVAIGTQSNCGGGETDWGTFLTCEENYADDWGEIRYVAPGRSTKVDASKKMAWGKVVAGKSLHYGWVTEIHPETGVASKLVKLGRFAHEGATFTRSKEGYPVVYMGDDAEDQFLYKFIADQKDSLDSGTLYVANIGKKAWIPLDFKTTPELRGVFESEAEMYVHTRHAASLVGATPLPRPEGIAIHPETQDVFVSLTNNTKKGNYFGFIAKLSEDGQDAGADSFEFNVFAAGGPKSGFACPDNICFDSRGNLWMTSDIADKKIGNGVYASFANNGLFVFPTSGPNSGRALQVASAPNRAEFTGPRFSPDGQTLFLSVQHPGVGTTSLASPLSRWHVRGDGVPRPAVIALSGELLNKV